jgi:hypothetical protein
MLLDRDIVSEEKLVVAESIARLLVLGVAEQIVMKGPRSARLADEMSDLVRLVAPETPNVTAVPLDIPLRHENPAFVRQRSDEFIASLAASFWEIVIASKLQANMA